MTRPREPETADSVTVRIAQKKARLELTWEVRSLPESTQSNAISIRSKGTQFEATCKCFTPISFDITWISCLIGAYPGVSAAKLFTRGLGTALRTETEERSSRPGQIFQERRGLGHQPDEARGGSIHASSCLWKEKQTWVSLNAFFLVTSVVKDFLCTNNWIGRLTLVDCRLTWC